MHVKRSSVVSHVRVIAPLVAALLGVAACGSATSGAPTAGTGAGMGGDTVQEATKDRVLFDSDFQGVCSGAPQPAAAAYDKASSGIHPVLGFGSMSTRSDAAKLSTLTIPEGFTRRWQDGKNTLAEVQLVVCAKRVKDSATKKCDGYKRDGKATGQVLTLHNATHEVKLHVAKTGAELATKTIEKPGKECPMFALGDQTDEYPDAAEEVVAFIQPFVKTG